MQNRNEHDETKSYVVRVGHTSVNVQASTDDEAIREARRRLAIDLPRMWDVIQNLDVGRFNVALQG